MSSSTVSPSLVTAFNSLSFLAIILVSLAILPPLISSRIKRSCTWFTHLISWLIYSLSFVLIVGQQTAPHQPAFGVCLFQASLIYSTPPLCAFSATFFLAEFYLHIRSFLYGSPVKKAWIRFFTIFPVVLFASLVCFALIFTRDPSSIERIESGFYCHIAHGPQVAISAVVIVIAATIMVPLQVITFGTLYCNRLTLREKSHTANSESFVISISVCIRMMLFSFIIAIAIGLTVVLTSKNDGTSSRIGSLLLPVLPILSAITFGTQTDVFRLRKKSQIQEHDNYHLNDSSDSFTSNPTSPRWMALDIYRKKNVLNVV